MSIIIYVEDEEEFSDRLFPLLQNHFSEHEVLHFYCGGQAISALRQRRDTVSLLITDIALGVKIDGLQVARAAMELGIKRIFILSRQAEDPLNNLYIDRFAQKFGSTFRLKNKPEDLATTIPLIKELLNADI